MARVNPYPLRANERARVRVRRGAPVVTSYPLYAGSRYSATQNAQFGDFGFSLKKVVKNVGKAVGKAVKDTGHAVGKVATSKVGQAITGVALAATGVGLPAAAAIGAAVKGGGALIAPGGNLKKAANAGVQGAAVGAAGSLAGKGARKVISKFKGKQPTYESDKRLDTLPTEIPSVSTIPSVPVATAPIPVATPVLTTVATDIAKPVITAATAIGAESPAAKDVVRKLARRARDEVYKRAKEAAQQQIAATAGVEPTPAAAPVPQGGFPAIPATTGPDAVAPATASVGGVGDFLSSPVGIAVAAGALLLLSRRK